MDGPPLAPSRVIGLAQSLFDELFDGPYEGEVCLCGGAFKFLMRPGVEIHDLDLWVRDDSEREKLRRTLSSRGAILVRDYVPHCVLMKCGHRFVEIIYGNIGDRPISEVVLEFDLALCSIATIYRRGRVEDCYVGAQAERSVREAKVWLNDGFVSELRVSHAPKILATLDRVEKGARELAYEAPTDVTATLWSLYREYSPEERKRCVERYLENVVDYKGRCNVPLLKQAIALI